ncbi:2-deoxy-D-gluconate 3-dehydrogenase [Phyllobacterium salinisoli]|uniref:2-deoxy-D-gluconate 3-dehydrogenase n=1 Tax=Phyllobacterium salinisoli TaxID=1899321 RepID=A0A368JYM7_9HYPH|nr:2-dehydro-3-deoxy-D-gluconate 5-dehydrogenase KduD [Phyllobacterium salinisoli]RCS22237.1 2-deoxy-D-gluconate 3-dehydrogenase [Phyllobacterium salinisoli]
MSGLFDLSGRRAFVTGANTGIGQAIALSLGEAGAQVICAGRSSMAGTLAKLKEAGATGFECLTDFADKDAAIKAFERAAETHGPIDILVNNAGIIRRADALDFTEADWDDVMDVNLKSVFFLCQTFARPILNSKAEGTIINIASMLSFQGGIRVASYTASKSGIAGLTKLLACEWAGKGINVNAIAPGYISTNNTEALRADQQRNDDILKRIPAGRWGEASDIGGAAVFLSSKAARYVHGAVIPVDGGWLAR